MTKDFKTEYMLLCKNSIENLDTQVKSIELYCVGAG
jgi:hypothetical protein